MSRCLEQGLIHIYTTLLHKAGNGAGFADRVTAPFPDRQLEGQRNECPDCKPVGRALQQAIGLVVQILKLGSRPRCPEETI